MRPEVMPGASHSMCELTWTLAAAALVSWKRCFAVFFEGDRLRVGSGHEIVGFAGKIAIDDFHETSAR
jgi:hypothetical protein